MTRKPSGLVVPEEPPKPKARPKVRVCETHGLTNVISALKALDRSGGRLIHVSQDAWSASLGGHYLIVYEDTDDLDFEELC